MNLDDFLFSLSTTELNGVFIAQRGEDGEYDDEKKRALISHVNAALTALYTRFNIKLGSVWLQTVKGTEHYFIDPKYAESTNSPDAYIKDAVMPLSGEVMKILAVSDADGHSLGINRVGDVLSLGSLKHNHLSVPEAHQGKLLRVEFRSGPQLVGDKAMYYPLKMVEIDIPDVYVQAMRYFVASRVVAPVGLAADSAPNTDNYMIRYENECRVLEAASLGQTEEYETHRFQHSGWI